jgi:hypothetical protein
MNYDESFTTLQFASRAIKIRVDAHINEKIEMKKLQDKLIDFAKIKNMDLNSNRRRSEDDINSDQRNNLRQDSRRRNSIEKGNSYLTEYNNRRSKSPDDFHRNNKNNSSYSPNQTSPNMIGSEKEDFSLVARKFHSLVLHLQGELAKSILKIHNLQEENKILKEKLAKN